MSVTLEPALTLSDLGPDDFDAAVELLARRHARHLEAEPLLDARFATSDGAREVLEPYIARSDALGAIARRGDDVVGYLLGTPRSSDPWGPNMWIEAPSVALAGGEQAETARDLYGHAAARWVDAGATAHYAVVPSHDRDLVDAFFRLGFGQQHVYAVQESPSDPPPLLREGLVVRVAEPDDIPVLARLDCALPEHQALAPVFSSGGLTTFEEAQQEWEDDFDDPEFRTFVAEWNGEVVGAAVVCALTKSSMHSGIALLDNAAFLGFACVLPEARGLGVGRALGETALDWAATSEYRSMVTDFRATNLHSSRTWTRLGFRPTFLRLHRHLGY